MATLKRGEGGGNKEARRRDLLKGMRKESKEEAKRSRGGEFEISDVASDSHKSSGRSRLNWD